MSDDGIMTEKEMVLRLQDMLGGLISPEDVTERDELALEKWRSFTEKDKLSFVNSSTKDKGD